MSLPLPRASRALPESRQPSEPDCHGGKTMRIVQSKKVCIMDKNQFFKKDALRPTVEQRLQTKPFYQNANLIYRRYDDWKGDDRFYFIPTSSPSISRRPTALTASSRSWHRIPCGWAHLSRQRSVIPPSSSSSAQSAALPSFLIAMRDRPLADGWTWRDTVTAAGKGSVWPPGGS